jgi:two-component system phosphate regulon sensor histidine kinase PhoR
VNKNPEKTVAAIVAIALTALISVQVYWARSTYKEAEYIFNEKVIKILNNVSTDANDAVTCFALYAKSYIDSGEGIYMMKSQWQGDEELWDTKHTPDSIPMFFNIPEEYKNSPLNKVYTDLKFANPATVEILFKFRYDMDETSPDKNILSQKFSKDNFKELIRNHEPLLTIYDTLMIDSLIRFQLKNNNMPSKYSYALVKTQNDSVEYSSNMAINSKILSKGIRTRFTPADLFSTPYDIVFYTADKPQYILKNIVWFLALSIGIVLLLLLASMYFMRTILRQKKLSAMKNDFINNMTHEFNTPISNISLAYETLKEKGKISSDEYSQKITGIIHSETERLKENVNRILSISTFERNGIDLIHEEIEASEILTTALSRLELKIKNKNALISINKPSHPVYFIGDKLHMTNAIENLVENALKYGNGHTEIDLDLEKKGNQIVIKVKDNGIGMTSEVTAKIFDKFYRAQNGNIQNERGFGIGLNYVKYVIDAHHGKISVNSRPGAGSCFQITLHTDEQ